MGLFNKEPIICSICGQDVKKSQLQKCRLTDGIICGDCASYATDWLGKDAGYSDLKRSTVATVREYVEKRKEQINRKKNFPADIVVGRMKINNKARQWCWTERLREAGTSQIDFDTGLDIFSFDDIEHIEGDSFPVAVGGETTITNNGLGRAVVGGVLAGSTGAILGAATAKQTVHSAPQTTVTCNRIYMKLKPYPGKTWVFPMPSREDMQTVMDILSGKQQALPAQQQAPATSDPAEELRKYKALADEGVITAEDYEAKKKQLLGL